ncbi:MAG: hypothetical protein ACI94Y_004060 [Maribacter sp.]|jgi:hypothetical protein
MKKTIFLFIFLFSLISLDTFAQQTSAQFRHILSFIENERHADFSNSGIEGSPYLDEEWQKSVIISKDDEQVEIEARYRYYDNVVEIRKENDETIYDLGLRHIKSITIGTQHFIMLNYTSKEGIAKGGFYELLIDEKINLFAQYDKILTDGQFHLLIQYDKVFTEAISDGYRNTSKTVNKRQSLFVYDQDGKEMTSLMTLNKKSILALFGDSSKQVKDYAKKNKLSFKKSNGLVKIFKYYNSLKTKK